MKDRSHSRASIKSGRQAWGSQTIQAESIEEKKNQINIPQHKLYFTVVLLNAGRLCMCLQKHTSSRDWKHCPLCPVQCRGREPFAFHPLIFLCIIGWSDEDQPFLWKIMDWYVLFPTCSLRCLNKWYLGCIDAALMLNQIKARVKRSF